MFLVAVMHGATEDTTPMVFQHRRRHLLAGDIPSPASAVGIFLADPDRGQFLANGIAIRDHHAARSMPPLFP